MSPAPGPHFASCASFAAVLKALMVPFAPCHASTFDRAAFGISLVAVMSAAACAPQPHVPAPTLATSPTPMASPVAVLANPTSLPAPATVPSPTATAAAAPSPRATSTPVAVATTAPSPAIPTGVATVPARVAPTGTPIAPTSAPQPAAAASTTRTWVERVAQFAAGQRSGLEIVDGTGARLSGSPGTGEYLSPAHTAAMPFDDVVLSWNADAAPGSSFRFELRVKDGSGWSGWYTMGEWTSEGGRSLPGQSDGRGRVEVDTLKLKQPAQSLQYRVKVTRGSGTASPVLRQVAVVYSDRRVAPAGPLLPRVPGAVGDLDVPPQSQLLQDPAYAKAICSATSTAMIMQYWGVKRSVAEVVSGVRDRTTGIYGNWPLNMAYAASAGLATRVERFYSMEQLEQEIAAGRPVAISYAYDQGELSAAYLGSTDGHLVVVRGFTADGNVIVNDPFVPDLRSVRRVYDREQVKRVWLRSGGVVYVATPRSGGPLAR